MKRLFCWALLAGTACIMAGCSTTSLMKSPAVQTSVAALTGNRQTDRVSRILCLWEPAQGQGLDEKPSRGFAGQLLFFEQGKPSPSPVKGIVKIHEYDNYDPDNFDQKPVHTFTFDSGAWNAHMTEGTLGHSYNVFIPYVNRHNQPAQCALQIEFIPENGRPVLSPFAEVTLPGRKSKTQTAGQTAIQRNVVRNRTERPDVVNAGYAESSQQQEKKLESMTIDLPSSSRRRMR